MGHRRGCRSNHGRALMVESTRPITITWLSVSALGLSNTGFIRACGVMRAARACRYCARPISAPSGVTAALLLMFCALKGATCTPRLARWRHRAVTTNDLPASLEQPMIMMGGAIRSLLRPCNGSPELLDSGAHLCPIIGCQRSQPTLYQTLLQRCYLMYPYHGWKQQPGLLPLDEFDIENCLDYLAGHPSYDDVCISCMQEHQRWTPSRSCRVGEREQEKEHFARLVVLHRSYLVVDSVGFAIAGEKLLRGEASPCFLVFSLCRLIQQNDHPYHLVRWQEFRQSLREFESPLRCYFTRELIRFHVALLIPRARSPTPAGPYQARPACPGARRSLGRG